MSFHARQASALVVFDRLCIVQFLGARSAGFLGLPRNPIHKKLTFNP
ncbi:MAG: hypothetical protein WCK39_08815 [Methanomassiliicoccales archaeon]